MDTRPPVRSHADGAAFGEFLRRARERRGLTLQQIAHETKIPQRHLDALERGNLSVVPPGLYQRAQIRAFAQAVGLDQKLAVAELEHALAASQPSAVAPPQPTSDRLRSRALGLLGIAILLTAAVSAPVVWSQKPALPQQSEPGAVLPQESESVAATPPESHDALPASPQMPEVFVEAPATDGVVEAAPPGDEAEGQLVVTTEPEGARVTVGGVGRGVTPITIAHLPLGPKRIRVTKDGYTGEEHVVPLAGDQPARAIHIPLRMRQ